MDSMEAQEILNIIKAFFDAITKVFKALSALFAQNEDEEEA